MKPSTAPTAPAVAVQPSIQVYDPEAAKAAGFKAISNGVNSRSESEIFLAMESTLKSCRSAWIRIAPHTYQAARFQAEIWKD